MIINDDLREEKRIYNDFYKIPSYDIDPNEFLQVQQILRLFQESASNHADKLKVGSYDLREKGYFWVLSRLKFEIRNFPKWKEKIQIKTWPSGDDRFFAYREFQIANENDEVIIAANSTWIVIDSKSKRPIKADTCFTDESVFLKKFTLDEIANKINKYSDFSDEYTYKIQYSDLDIHNHANNVKYVEWVLNSYSIDFHKKNKIKSCEINYISEASIDEQIIIKTKKNR